MDGKLKKETIESLTTSVDRLKYPSCLVVAILHDYCEVISKLTGESAQTINKRINNDADSIYQSDQKLKT
jgi:hypothetical protein